MIKASARDSDANVRCGLHADIISAMTRVSKALRLPLDSKAAYFAGISFTV